MSLSIMGSKLFCCFSPHLKETGFLEDFFLTFGFVECPTRRSFKALAIAANPLINGGSSL